MRPGLVPVVTLGITAALLRSIGQVPAADLVALAYLFVATIAFGRPVLMLTRSRTRS